MWQRIQNWLLRHIHRAVYLGSSNLLANPKVSIEVRRQRVPVVARDATPEERAAYWARITSQAKNYLGYEKKTSRGIPLVVLERV